MVFLGSVSAAQTTVGDYKFNIPDGYKQDHSMDVENKKTSINSVDCHADSKTFTKQFQQISPSHLQTAASCPTISNHITEAAMTPNLREWTATSPLTDMTTSTAMSMTGTGLS